jgi:hypothetical protein
MADARDKLIAKANENNEGTQPVLTKPPNKIRGHKKAPGEAQTHGYDADKWAT